MVKVQKGIGDAMTMGCLPITVSGVEQDCSKLTRPVVC